MLRIESYVTPIILSYVNKYIKNLKAEDSQVSLWGGEAVFSNLDLRLDVLEEELSLPFSFVNGHIHELRIRVPWTKLTSEPIVITINTIECILKLRDGSVEGSECSSSNRSEGGEGDASPSHSTEIATRKKSRRQELEAPTSYVQNLVSRIVNNVSITCNNLVLKYVEDDIVLSLNIKTFEMKAVNGQWKPAFIDVVNEDYLLRHLGTITDLTVCLDKRNASGKIENYQEPLLYRCSLSLRIVQKYSPSSPNLPPISVRYHLYSPLLHFSLSDTQLPMFARLVALAMALSNGELDYMDTVKQDIQKQTDKPVVSTTSTTTTSSGNVSPTTTITTGVGLPSSSPNIATDHTFNEAGSHHSVDTDDNSENTWSSWAWSVGSALLPLYWDDEEDQNEQRISTNHSELEARLVHRMKRTLEFGIYVKTATWVFKVTESVQDIGYFVPSRMKFRPFLRGSHHGSYASVTLHGVATSRVRLGVAEVRVEPLGSRCVCGVPEGLDEDSEVHSPDQSPSREGSSSRDGSLEPKQTTTSSTSSSFPPHYLHCGERSLGYLSGSLFAAEEEEEEEEKHRSNSSSSDDTEDRLETESELLSRTAAAAMDFLYHLDVPEDVSPDHLARLYANLEYSNLPERGVARVAVGMIEMVWNSGCYHRLATVQSALCAYDYTPYGGSAAAAAATATAAPHEQPTEHDIAALSALPVPYVAVSLTVRSPRVVVMTATHHQPLLPRLYGGAAGKRRKMNQRVVRDIRVGSIVSESSSVTLVLGARRLEGELRRPMYPRRVALTAAAAMENARTGGGASEAVLQLLKAGHITVNAKMMDGSAWLCDIDQAGSTAVCVLERCSPVMQYSTLLLPHLYTPDPALLHNRLDVAGSAVAGVSAAQALILSRMVASWSGARLRDTDTALSDAMRGALPVLCLKLTDVAVELSSTHDSHSAMASLGSSSVTLREATHVLRLAPHDLSTPEVVTSCFSDVGKLFTHGDEHIRGRIKCLMMYGPENRVGLEVHMPQMETNSEKLLHGVLQWPYDLEDESVSVVFTLSLQKVSLLVDPSFLDFITYCPVKKSLDSMYESFLNKKLSEVRMAPQRQTSGSGSETATTRPASSTATTSALSSAPIPPLNHPRLNTTIASPSPSSSTAPSTWKHLVRRWCPVLQRLLVHLDLQCCSVFLPSGPLNINCESALSNAVHRTYLTRSERPGLGDTTVVNLPHVTLHNSANKTSLLDCVAARQLPIRLPVDFVGPGYSSLPWCASLRDFGVLSLQGDGPHVRLPILKPVNTTATISIVTKQHRQGAKAVTLATAAATAAAAHDGSVKTDVQQNPSVTADSISNIKNSLSSSVNAGNNTQQPPTPASTSIVVHADMSPVRVCGSKRQVQAHVGLVEAYISTALRVASNFVVFNELVEFECSDQGVFSAPALALPNTVEGSTRQEPSFSVVTAWIQWTVAKVSATLYAEKCQREQPLDCDMTAQLQKKGFQEAVGQECNSSVLEIIDGDLAVQGVVIAAAVPVAAVGSGPAYLPSASKVVTRMENKLRAEMEDLTMAVDLQQVYTKIKCRVTAFNVTHAKLKGNTWVSGDNEGVIVTATSSNILDTNLHVLNPERSKSEPLNVQPPQQHRMGGGGEQEGSKSHHGFLAFTLTSAVSKNVHGKWDLLVNRDTALAERISCDRPDNNTLTEIDIRVQPLDFVLSSATLKPFTQVYEPWIHMSLPSLQATCTDNDGTQRCYMDSQKALTGTSAPLFRGGTSGNSQQLRRDSLSASSPSGVLSLLLNLNNRSLPLLYLHLEGLRVFLPSGAPNTTDTCGHDLIFLQLSSLLVSPQVDNPVERVVERLDIWKVAEQARVLYLPGSVLEDRQYQLDLLGLSVSTGMWSDVVASRCGRPRSTSHEQLKLMGENPALEWNNYNPSEGRLDDAVPPPLHPVLVRFDTRIILAPSVVHFGDWLLGSVAKTGGEGGLQFSHLSPHLPAAAGGGRAAKPTAATQSSSGASCMAAAPTPPPPSATSSAAVPERRVLVAGHSLEVNATSPVQLYASLPQIMLLTHVVRQLSRLLEVPALQSRGTAVQLTVNSSGEVADSGIDCDASSSDLRLTTPGDNCATCVPLRTCENVKLSDIAPKLVAGSHLTADSKDVDTAAASLLAAASVSGNTRNIQHVTFSLPSQNVSKPVSAKQSDKYVNQDSVNVIPASVTTTASTIPSRNTGTKSSLFNIGVAENSTTAASNSSLGARLGLVMGGEGGCEDEAELVPLDVLLTASRISLCLYDKLIAEPRSYRSGKVVHRTKGEQRVRREAREAQHQLAMPSSESEASPSPRDARHPHHHHSIRRSVAPVSRTANSDGALLSVQHDSNAASEEEVECCKVAQRPRTVTVSSLGCSGEPEDGYEGSEEGSMCGEELPSDYISSISQPTSLTAAPDLTSESVLVTASPAPAVAAPCYRLVPLVFCSVSQPHAYLGVQRRTHRLELACFDLTLRGAPQGHVVKGGGGKQVATCEDHVTPWLDTRLGDVHPKTGIPPSLLTVSCVDFLTRPAKVKVDIGRPVRVCLCESKCGQVNGVASTLRDRIPWLQRRTDASLREHQEQQEKQEQQQPHDVREYFQSIDSVSVTTTQIVLTYELPKTLNQTTELTNSLQGFMLSVSANRKSTHMIGCTAAIQPTSAAAIQQVSDISVSVNVKDYQLRTSYHSLKLLPLIKPWTFSIGVKLLWMPWSSDPYLEATVASEVLILDVGPEHLFALQDIYNYFAKKLRELSNDSARSAIQCHETPPLACKESSADNTFQDVVYQDDLRAGVFQYSKTGLSNREPKPYQIVFDNETGTMLWCYPEPRALTRVDILPVPFVAAADATSDPMGSRDKVSCALQYYDSLRKEFITYRQFDLSESALCQLELPSLYEKQHVAVATTWRIVLDYSVEDDCTSGGTGRLLVPAKALAACIRVDSVFSVPLLPKRQLFFSLNMLQVALQNHMRLTGKRCPPDLAKYKLVREIPDEHEFLTLQLNNTKVYCNFWSSSVYFEAQSSMEGQVLNYTFLTNNTLLEPASFSVKAIFHKSLRDDKPQCVDVQVFSKPLYVHVSQTTLDTVILGHQMWSQAFAITANVSQGPEARLQRCLPYPLLCRYTLCNATGQGLRVGQADTEEGRLLEASQAFSYSWRTHKKAPLLRLCRDTGRWKWSRPFCLDKEGSFVSSSNSTSAAGGGGNAQVLVTVSKHSENHVFVTFSTLLVLANAMHDDLEVKLMTAGEASLFRSSGTCLKIRAQSSLDSLSCDVQSVRVRLISCPPPLSCVGGASAPGPWSDPILIGGEGSVAVKDSVIIKLPTRNKGEAVHVWCSVLRQRFSSTPSSTSAWRCLVVLSPQYVVRSHLPRPLILHVNTPATKRTHQLTIPGAGGSASLHSCEASLSHQLTFQLRPELPQSSPPIPLHRSMADQMRQSGNSQTVDVSDICRHMFDNPSERWPYANNNAEDDTGAPNLCTDQPKIDLQIGFSSLHPHLNTVVVEVRPWALIINHTSVEVCLQDGDSAAPSDVNDIGLAANTWLIPNNGVFAPPKLSGTFRLGVMEDSALHLSTALQMSKEDRWYSLKFEGCVPRTGSTNIVIYSITCIYSITLVTEFKESIQVIRLLPTYSISNNTKDILSLRPISVSKTNTTSSCSLDPNLCPVVTVPRRASGKRPRELPLLSWVLLSRLGAASPVSAASPSGVDCWQCVQLGRGNVFGEPLLVTETTATDIKDHRLSFTLPATADDNLGSEAGNDFGGDSDRTTRLTTSNKPYLLTVHQDRSRVHLVLQEDKQPQMIIYNNTMITLLLGEGSVKRPGSVESPRCATIGLPWAPPTLGSGQCCALSFHHRNSTLEEVPPLPSSSTSGQPRLHLAHGDLSGASVWSHGVDLIQTYDQFENICGLGDVKIHTERLGPVVHVFVDTASRVEVSARDIRSRIAARTAQTAQQAAPALSVSGVTSNKKFSASVLTDANQAAADRSVPQQGAERSCFVESVKTAVSGSGVISSQSLRDGAQVLLSKKSVGRVQERTTVVFCTVLCSQMTLILQDDQQLDEDVREVLRVVVDNVVVSVRPKLDMSAKLRCLYYRVRELMEIRVFVGDAQIDNQLYSQGNYDFPVILMFQQRSNLSQFSPHIPMERIVQIAHNQAKFTILFTLEKTQLHGHYCQSIELKLQPLTLYAEDVFFYSLMNILHSFVLSNKVSDTPQTNTKTRVEEATNAVALLPTPHHIMSRSRALCLLVDVFSLTVSEIYVHLSVHASVTLYIALDQTPLNFAAYQRHQVVTTSYSLGHNMARHYLSGALVRAGWVVGSLEILGNPGGFARTVGSGMRDFVQLPYEGILLGPWAFVTGITHGSLSLVKHFTAGTVVSLTNLAGSLARNMDRLSLDCDHLSRTEQDRRMSRPHGVLRGLAFGLTTFGISLLGGIGGLAQQPLEAMLQEQVSASGLVGGVGRGVLGALTKPIGGAADLFLHTGQGFLKGAGWQEEQQPRSAPILTPRSAASNTQLKVSCKLLAELPVECRLVLAAVEATLLSPAGSVSAVTVILTPQVVFLVCCASDQQQCALPLLEVKCRASSSDPTLLLLHRQLRQRVGDPAEQLIACPERVREYVLGTASCDSVEYCLVGEGQHGAYWLHTVPPAHSNDAAVPPQTARKGSTNASIGTSGHLPHVPSDEVAPPFVQNEFIILEDDSEDNNDVVVNPISTTNNNDNNQQRSLSIPEAAASSASCGPDDTARTAVTTTATVADHATVQLMVAPGVRDGLVAAIVLAQRAMQGRGFIL